MYKRQPLNSVDVVIVAIGENFGASIRVVALLKQKKVKRIYARAIDGVHRSVLEAFGLDRILTPEEDAARGLVHLLEFGADIETFRVDSNYYVVNFTVPEKFIGYNVNELKLDSEFGLKLLALKRAETLKNCLGISFTEHDVVNELMCIRDRVYSKVKSPVYIKMFYLVLVAYIISLMQVNLTGGGEQFLLQQAQNGSTEIMLSLIHISMPVHLNKDFLQYILCIFVQHYQTPYIIIYRFLKTFHQQLKACLLYTSSTSSNTR